MNMYIFEYVSQVSDSYHSGGGLAIVAESLEAVKQMTNGTIIFLDDSDLKSAKVYPLMGNPEPKIFVFPDAGCC